MADVPQQVTRLAVLAIITCLALGAAAGLTAAFTSHLALWTVGYCLLGLAVLFAAFYRIAVALNKRGLW
jgi:hypothetical protein